jgi:hypothetical protein
MTTDIDPTTRLRVPAKGVAADILDNEVVIVNLSTGHYFSTDGVGCEVWQLLSAGTPIGEVVSTLRGRYTGGGDEAIEPYVHDIVRRVLEKGLMVIDDGSEPSTEAAPAASDILEPAAEGQSFVPSMFLGFDDMESLLLLDPVHEVDDKGWPHAAPGV